MAGINLEETKQVLCSVVILSQVALIVFHYLAKLILVKEALAVVVV